MTQILFSPLVAFPIFLALAGGLSLIGKALAGPTKTDPAKSSIYSSGEASPTRTAAPGYRPFLVAALFFAVLHLGVLVLATGAASPIAIVFLLGLMLALLALILG